MKAVIAAIIVSVIVASAASAGVTTMITSKDIKNGTIRPVDLSAAAKRAMRGPQGIQGQSGPRGFQGLPGVRGPAGFNTVETKWGEGSMGPNSSGTASVICSSGKPVGGGFKAFSPSVWVYESYPTYNGWQVRGYNNSGTYGAALWAYVLCAG